MGENIVSNYRGILSGSSWVTSFGTLKTSKKPVFLTFSFPTFMPEDDRKSWPEDEKKWRAFSAQDRIDAKAALKQWGDASGVRFLEAKKDHGDIQFSWIPQPGTQSAFAYHPSNYSPYGEPNTHTHFYPYAGNVYMNTEYSETFRRDKAFKTYILLHEIGHALGLKHPFNTSNYNNSIMSTQYDSVKYSVMAYTSDGDASPTKLAPFDLQAIRALYGTGRSDAKHVKSWHWNAKKEILTLKGKAGSDVIQGTGGKDVISGGGGDDRLLGLSGDDVLSGGSGSDVLIGGTGRDIFRFDTDPSSDGADVIYNFEKIDWIHLSGAIFAKLGPKGALAAGVFEIGAKATSAATRILYDGGHSDGLFYDPDGSGPEASIKIASFQVVTDVVNASHFLII
ncbi:M10 family metallopeptidase [Microvirga brassicacearum]|uniref:Matrixin family metalloprotease n=1 Tax=Microvirga brassicacearum TaxID=2580413 RepID=A0A5N3PIJ2_9HYPH|nr:matrixin family metalloprotease [Microvirga brassicacearum]KAB0269547.1 matrixin family metalloprotease [Microvirga brassicacearum]